MIMLRARVQGLRAPGGGPDNTVPVGPKRSVLIVAAAWPASTSRDVAASTKPDGPQTKMSGLAAGGGASRAITAASMRPACTPGRADLV
jgi:hypothetical protein